MKKIFLLAFIICVIIIQILAFSDSKNINLFENTWDKAKHAFAFFVLFCLLNLSRLRLKISLAILLFFAFWIEIVQFFLPNRDFSLLDIFADIIGMIIGIFIMILYKNYFKYFSSKKLAK